MAQFDKQVLVEVPAKEEEQQVFMQIKFI